MGDTTIIKWAFEHAVVGIFSGFTQDQGKPPKQYIELTSVDDSIRINVDEFTRLFEVGYNIDMTIARLVNEEMLKAKEKAAQEVIDKAELKEYQRLQKKYG